MKPIDDLPPELQQRIRQINERIAPFHFYFEVEDFFPRRTVVREVPVEERRQLAWAFGVPLWLVDKRFNTRAEHWRWRWHQWTRPWRWLKRNFPPRFTSRRSSRL